MQFCHDLKKENNQVAPPLPSSFKLIPILFYMAIAGCAFFAAYYLLQYNQAEKDRAAQEAIMAQEKKKTTQIEAQTTQLNEDLGKAKSMIEWVRGSRSVQPLALLITRKMDPGNSIVELSLERKIENPWQLQLFLRLNSDNIQLEDIIEKLRTNNYRAFSPVRNQGGDTLDYRATLIYQDRKTTT